MGALNGNNTHIKGLTCFHGCIGKTAVPFPSNILRHVYNQPTSSPEVSREESSTNPRLGHCALSYFLMTHLLSCIRSFLYNIKQIECVLHQIIYFSLFSKGVSVFLFAKPHTLWCSNIFHFILCNQDEHIEPTSFTTTTKTSISFRLTGISGTCSKPLQVSSTYLTTLPLTNTAQGFEMENNERLHESGNLMYSLAFCFCRNFVFNSFFN